MALTSSPNTDCSPSGCSPQSNSSASLTRVGGKGLNLAKLIQAGFPAPSGFFVTTDTYDAFVNRADITGWLAEEAAKEEEAW